MSKKSKKQRSKTRQTQVRRQSGITMRAVVPPTTVGKVLELRRPAPPPATDVVDLAAQALEAQRLPLEERPVDLATDEVATPRNAMAPGKLDADVAAPPEAESVAAPPEAESVVAPPAAESVAAPPAAESVVAPSGATDHDFVEHRASQRVTVAVDIHLSSDSHFFSGLSGDISEGGLFLSTYRSLSVGSEVDVEFSLPGTARVVQARGAVRWIREHTSEQSRGVGIAFDNLSDEDRDEIQTFCSSRPPLYYEDVG